MNENRDGYRDEQQAMSVAIIDGRADDPKNAPVTDGGAEVADERPDRDADIEVYVDELTGTNPSRVIGYRSTPSHERSIDSSTHSESDIVGEAMATLIEGLKGRVELAEYPDEYVLALVWLDDDHRIDYVEWDSPEFNPEASDAVEDDR